MEAYLYDNENFYLGSTSLQESPLEPGVYFDQSNSTRIAPPSYGENEIPVWDGSWGIAPDYSSKPYYSKIDKSEKRYKRGEAFDLNYTDLVPPPESYIVWKENSWVEDAEKLKQFNAEKRITELKALLAASDFRIIPDYFNTMTVAEQTEWTQKRSAWRDEIRSLSE